MSRVTTKVRRQQRWTWAIVALPIVVAVIATFFVGRDGGRAEAAAIAGGTIFVALLALQLAGGDRGLFALVIGKDRRTSTSLTIAGLWTVAVTWGIAYFVGRVLCDGADFDTLVPSDDLDAYLVLLGGPYAAAVIAKVSTQTGVDGGTNQKVDETGGATLGQVVQNDDGSLSLTDAQYVVFNAILLVYFVAALIQDSVLPPVPVTVYALTGVSAAGYAAKKLTTSDPPKITAISPRRVKTGDTITIMGVHFAPRATVRDHAGPADPARPAKPTVLVDGVEATVLEPTETRITATVPDLGGAVGPADVTVITVVGVETDPVTITVTK